MHNPFDEIIAKIDGLTTIVRTLKSGAKEKPADEIGGLELAMAITGLARRTIYKLTHRREIPHRRVGGRLYFRRSELEQWIDNGRRKTVSEIVEERMEGHRSTERP